MKRLLLIPALILGTVATAAEYNYEITPLIGYNIAEGNIDVDDYAVFGAELQYNGYDSVIKPELSLLYSKADYNTIDEDTDIWRVAVNGVYEYDKLGFITPLAKVGLGYERMSDFGDETGNRTNCGFVDLGVGAKIPFSDMLALKLEAVYMFKHNDGETDSNLALLAGLNFTFGEKAQKAAPVVAAEPTPEPTPEPEPVIAPEPTPVVAAAPVVVDGDNDTDKDGVLNAQDICPNTPLGETVNSDGCPKKITLHVKFEYNSADITPDSYGIVQKYADFLNKNTNYSTKIVGYTDSRGSEAYNQKLSEKRANSIMNHLVEKGVDPKQLSASGKGEANPIADNATDEGRAQNRRIEAELTRN